MKIKLFILAFDSCDVGTDVRWFYTRRELNRCLVDLLMDHESQEHAAALQAIESDDSDALDNLFERTSARSWATWHSDEIIVDVVLAEKIADPTAIETVTILKPDYDEMVSDQEILNRLRAAGVDNWEGYSTAFDE